MKSEIELKVEPTPNPDSLKFMTGETLLATGSRDYASKPSTGESPLASVLFEIPGVLGIFITQDFVTVSKDPAQSWDELVPILSDQITLFLRSGQPAVTAGPTTGPTPSPSTENTEVEEKIRTILDNEIRPAVAMDGGDVVFYSYENGIVKLHLQGACSSCPSSIMTLKAGVENRLKMEIPEIKEVVQI